MKRSYKFLYHMACEHDFVHYLSHMREASLRRSCPWPDLSVREILAVLHRWELDWDDHRDDNDREDNHRISGDHHFATQGAVVEIENSDPDSCILRWTRWPIVVQIYVGIGTSI